jgi:hypothetical protein
LSVLLLYIFETYYLFIRFVPKFWQDWNLSFTNLSEISLLYKVTFEIEKYFLKCWFCRYTFQLFIWQETLSAYVIAAFISFYLHNNSRNKGTVKHQFIKHESYHDITIICIKSKQAATNKFSWSHLFYILKSGICV